MGNYWFQYKLFHYATFQWVHIRYLNKKEIVDGIATKNLSEKEVAIILVVMYYIKSIEI